MAKFWLITGSLSAFLSVALGAFGAHGLKNHLSSEMIQTWDTAVHYQQFHSLALILLGILIRWAPDYSLLNWSGALLLGGIILFSGSLYLISLTDVRSLGMVTPLGGLSFLAGWLLLAVALFKKF